MVSVIIINYNTYELTKACIESVIAHTKETHYEIILVDNASSERDPNDFKSAFPSIKLVISAENLGFAGGNNLGIKYAKGDLLLLLNSDTVLTEDSISKSANAFLSAKKIGVLGCRMTFPDGKVQFTARKFRSISWELLDLFRFLLWFLPYEKRASLMLGKYFRHDKSAEADWLNGAFFMISKEVLNKLSEAKLDDRFFMYAEDVLWCEQIKALGYRILFFADTTIIHINSGSTSAAKQLKLKKVMLKHECEIMALRKGKGLYYFIFWLIFSAKENARYLIKLLFKKR